MLRRTGLICIAVVLILLLVQKQTAAQSVSNLQADIQDLRSRVYQLQATVNQLNRQPTGSVRVPVPSRPLRNPADPTDTQMIDRLAILAIEAKDRLNFLEDRVTRLEKRLK